MAPWPLRDARCYVSTADVFLVSVSDTKRLGLGLDLSEMRFFWNVVLENSPLSVESCPAVSLIYVTVIGAQQNFNAFLRCVKVRGSSRLPELYQGTRSSIRWCESYADIRSL